MPAFPSMPPPPRREGLPVAIFFFCCLADQARSSAPSLGRMPWKAGHFCETLGPCLLTTAGAWLRRVFLSSLRRPQVPGQWAGSHASCLPVMAPGFEIEAEGAPGSHAGAASLCPRPQLPATRLPWLLLFLSSTNSSASPGPSGPSGGNICALFMIPMHLTILCWILTPLELSPPLSLFS